MGKISLILIYFTTIFLFAKTSYDKIEVLDSNTKVKKELLKSASYDQKAKSHHDMYVFSDDILVEKKVKKSLKKSKIKKKKLHKKYSKKRYPKYKQKKHKVYTKRKKIKKRYKYKRNIRKKTIQSHPKKQKKLLKKKIAPKRATLKIKKHTMTIPSKKTGLNLRDAILKALSRNKKILSLKEKVIQAKRIVDQKRATLYPIVNLTGTTSKNINSEEGKEDKDNFFKDEAQISITENLYAGGKTTNDIKMAKAKVKSALSKYQQSLEKEILNIIQAYLSVIYEKKSITANRENIKALNKILNIVTIKEKNGAATKGDLNYIKSNIENTKSELVLAESKFKNSISYYEYYVGDINDGNYPIEENIKVSINPNANIEKLVLKNPQLKELEAKIKSLKYELESKKSRFKPTVDLILTAKNKSSSLEGDPSQRKKSAALSFNYPIFNGGADKARLFELKSRIDEQKYKYIDLKKSLTFNAIQILNNMSSTKDSLEHIINQLHANQKVVDSYWNAFKYGNQDLQALLLAQNALNKTKLDKLRSEKSYTNQYFQLLSSVGALLRYFGIEYLVNVNTINQHAKISIFGSNLDD